MTTRRQLLAAAAGALCCPASVAAQALPLQDDAMWVWGDPILAPDRALPDFAERRRIATLYVYVSPAAADALLSGRREAVEAVEAMAARGRRLYAVAGEPDWAPGDAGFPAHAALLVRLTQTTRLFEGLHFDVEPNALPQWLDPAAQPRLAEHTLRFYERARSLAPSTRIDAAVNPIFAAVPVRNGNFMRLLAERVSSVSLMAYRAGVARAIDWSRPAVAEIVAAKRPWRMGVLAGDGEPGTSWKCATPPRFVAAIAELRQGIEQDFPTSLCTGLAFQDYQGLAGLFDGSRARDCPNRRRLA
jgi:hypothetical protein